VDSSNTESVGKKNKRGWAAQTLLTSYDRPGNVRQLENAIVHALVMGSGEFIRPEDLPETLTERKSAVEPETSATYHAVLNALIRNALQKTGGDYQAAARLLDVHFTYLYRLARNLNIQ